ncbi:MAG TPA: alpha/beta hydrolase [Methylomirabilota bacterium]|nr:alpha/beta hydrolase [Methylomirabilota bacterium]
MRSRTGLRRMLFPELPLLRVVLSLAFVYAAVAGLAWFFADRMIFLPPPPTYRDTAEIVKIPTADGPRIAALYLANPEARYTLLYSHGNAEDLGVVRPILPVLRQVGFAVLAYDYRGYGTSEGSPSERHAYGDIEAAYQHLVRERGVPSDRVIAYGRSVGAGAAVDLASRRPLAGLIVESGFVTAFRVMTRLPLLPFDKFRNIDKIGHVRCPVLVMHGEADEIVPLWHGQRLFQAAPPPKRLLAVAGAHHNDFMWVAGERYARALREFEALLRGR